MDNGYEWDFASIAGGRGVYFGDVFSVNNHTTGWPGEGDEKIWVDAEGNLVLHMEKKQEHKEERKHEHFLRREFSYEQFHQEFALPENADIEKISAHMEHGVLNILIPKLTPQEVKKNIRQIEIG